MKFKAIILLSLISTIFFLFGCTSQKDCGQDFDCFAQAVMSNCSPAKVRVNFPLADGVISTTRTLELGCEVKIDRFQRGTDKLLTSSTINVTAEDVQEIRAALGLI